ncbi:hypothetical protein [Spongiactinospora sp. TRM90649]|uniref:hypothetical protein n=1 Tax=Spongiactinospora sp. TRM90649 TaxID=3031114 RepID=UPI0023F6BCA5|nr:hypothetical protein [Spongiactinospora sp. TRM90649]MDF5751317.1 hypothetical protein [Spongiactinospora sp. TRM90649]
MRRLAAGVVAGLLGTGVWAAPGVAIGDPAPPYPPGGAPQVPRPLVPRPEATPRPTPTPIPVEPPAADLSVRMTSYPRVAQPGRPVGYRVEVGNAGPGPAVRPELRVRLPQGMKVLSVDVAECRPGTSGGSGEVVCASGSDVLSGGHGVLTVVGMVPPEARGPLRAVATIRSSARELNPADNTAETVNQVGEGADLAIRLDRVDRARRGGLPGATLRALVTNHGPQAVQDGQLFLRIRGARLLSSDGARCGAYAGYVGCRLQPVKVGAATRVRMVFVPAANARHGRRMTASAMVYSAVLGDRRPDNGKARLRIPFGG